MDIVMPGMDGMETCEKLRQRYPEANVYMVSSMAYDDMIDRAVELGAKGFLFKPFTKDALLEGLQGAFNAIESEREKAVKRSGDRMSEYKAQENDLIYALDIGTRSVIGMVGQTDGDRFKVLDVEAAEHKKRAMIDGQIDNIRQVAEVVRQVTQRLEERLNVSLERVCVAAAGRALQTKAGTFSLSLPENNVITVEQVSQLETGAVSAAEETLQTEDDERRRLFLVGYTVTQYRLDHYPMVTLLDHSGVEVEADVVADLFAR